MKNLIKLVLSLPKSLRNLIRFIIETFLFCTIYLLSLLNLNTYVSGGLFSVFI